MTDFDYLVTLSLTDLEEALDGLKHRLVLQSAQVFTENLSDLSSSLRLPYAALAYGNIKGLIFARHSGEMWAKIFSGASEVDISAFAESLGQQGVDEALAKENLGIDGQKLIAEFHAVFASHPEQLGALKSQLKAAILLSWSAFENLTADLWVQCLNAYPQTLATNILNRRTDQQEQKRIEPWQLQKYGYDLRDHMGTILKDRYQFSNTDGIKKAYVDAFGPTRKSALVNILSNPNLNLLEAARHNIAHRTGTIDGIFLSRTKSFSSFLGKEGEPLSLTGSFVSRLVSTAIEAGGSLIKAIDNWLPENATSVDETQHI